MSPLLFLKVSVFVPPGRARSFVIVCLCFPLPLIVSCTLVIDLYTNPLYYFNSSHASKLFTQVYRPRHAHRCLYLQTVSTIPCGKELNRHLGGQLRTSYRKGVKLWMDLKCYTFSFVTYFVFNIRCTTSPWTPINALPCFI